MTNSKQYNFAFIISAAIDGDGTIHIDVDYDFEQDKSDDAALILNYLTNGDLNKQILLALSDLTKDDDAVSLKKISNVIRKWNSKQLEYTENERPLIPALQLMSEKNEQH